MKIAKMKESALKNKWIVMRATGENTGVILAQKKTRRSAETYAMKFAELTEDYNKIVVIKIISRVRKVTKKNVAKKRS